MNRKNKLFRIIMTMAALSLLFLQSSCGGGGGGGGGSAGLSKENILITSSDVRKWTFVIYMAADNELEYEAMRNINQLEGVASIAHPDIAVLVLLDRSPGYDSTDGDWSDTRLYEILPDSNGINSAVVSKRLACPALEITEDGTKELDMSDWRTLNAVLSFANSEYPAEKTALIMWGHGTGWRSSGSSSASRAFAIDDTSGGSMPITLLKNAASGKNLSFIGFDTCFSALLETSYELKDCCQYVAGTPGLAPADGWNYNALFTTFLNSEKTADDFMEALVSTYRSAYASVEGAGLSVISSAKVQNTFDKFEAFAGVLAGCIDSAAIRNGLLKFIFDNVSYYGANSYPSDYFLDINDFAVQIKNKISDYTTDAAKIAAVTDACNDLSQAVSQTVVKSWNQKGIASPIGVHFVPLTGFKVPASRHSEAYTKGTAEPNKPQFVLDSVNYVPSQPVASSLLDKLFYYSF